MNEEFVTYNQALALKELGFNEECFGAFIGKEFKFFNFSNDIKGYANENNLIIGRPTYSQAFRWFRKKYGLVTSNPPTEMDNLILFKGIIYKCKAIRLGNTVDVLYNSTYNTYEEAESECLDKLIEIVKEKNK